MSEYWKSLPKKFCDACKCWFADNRASIDFHEKGKRHKENVQKRLNMLMKKGQKEHEAQQRYEAAMKKIEKEAMKAFAKDVAVNPSLVTQYGEIKSAKKDSGKSQDSKPSSGISSRSKTFSTPVATIPQPKPRCWYEAKSENDTVYYWNSETGESQWESPKDYVTIAEQERIKKLADDNNVPESISSFGPMNMSQPYGQWTPVVKRKMETIDLQLPECSEESTTSTIIVASDEPSKKFKEKTIGSLTEKYGESSSEGTFFKKRKNTDSFKRNIRQREDD